VNGRGIEILRQAGVRVDVAEGDIAMRMKRQNDGLHKVVATGQPFVTYKYAMTVDGRLATDSGDSRWISSPESRALVHQWRAWSDAVLVGAGTVEVDDPLLTAREVGCEKQPLRVVVGIRETLTRESALVASLAQGPVLVVGGEGLASSRRGELESWGLEVATVEHGADGLLVPPAVGSLLVARGVQTVLLEGGRRLAGSWWQAGLIDKVAAFVCPQLAPGFEHRGALRTAGPARMEHASRLKEVEVTRAGDDMVITGYTRDVY
jgi:diaminohydroxyphosphoribosylaminopyrimidine deaminase/5-amino-6-(5-phosphoribosylamino)uracil reductase